MRDHRNAALALHPLDQGRPAARHDDVDHAAHLQHHADRGTVTRRHELYRVFRQIGSAQAVLQGRDQRARGMKALRAATQDHRIARFERDAAGIGGDVRAALIDDADDAERHADPGDPQPVGPGPFGEGAADRVGQRGDVLEAAGDRFEPLRVERQPVEQGRADAGLFRLGKILGIGGEDLIRASADRGGGGFERSGFGISRGERQRCRRFAGLSADCGHRRGEIGRGLRRFFEGGVAHDRVSVTTRSSRWMISSRPRYPRIAAISPLLCPAMRAMSALA